MGIKQQLRHLTWARALRLLLLILLLALVPREMRAIGFGDSSIPYPSDNSYGKNYVFSDHLTIKSDTTTGFMWGQSTISSGHIDPSSAKIYIVFESSDGTEQSYYIGKLTDWTSDYDALEYGFISEREFGQENCFSHHGYVALYGYEYEPHKYEPSFKVAIDRYFVTDTSVRLLLIGEFDWFHDGITTRCPITSYSRAKGCSYGKVVTNPSIIRSNNKIAFYGTGDLISGTDNSGVEYNYSYHLELYTDADCSRLGSTTTSARQPKNLTATVNNYDVYYPVVVQVMERGNMNIGYEREISDEVVGKIVGAQPVVVNGYPRPKEVEATTKDATQKIISVNWVSECADANHVDTNGKWKVWRDCNGERIFVGEYDYTTTSIEDKDLAYDNKYTYTVVFCPDGWTVEKESDAEGLSAVSNEVDFKRDFAFSNLQIGYQGGTINFSWEHPSITDASAQRKYTMYLERSMSTEADANWTLLKSYSIESPSIVSGSYADSDPTLRLEETYYYRLRIYVQESNFYSDVEQGRIFFDGGSEVSQLKASRGTYSNLVRLYWNVNQIGADDTYFELSRRPLGSTDDADWAIVHTAHGVTSTYNFDDVTALPGSYYEYHLRIYRLKNNVEKSIFNYYTDGFSVATGILSGRVYYGNGTAVADARIRLRPNDVDGNIESSFRSLDLGAQDAGVQYKSEGNHFSRLLNGKDFAVQLFVRPAMAEATPGSFHTLLDLDHVAQFGLMPVQSADGRYYVLQVKNQGGEPVNVIEDQSIAEGQWTHLTVTYQADKQVLNAFVPKLDDNGNYKASTYSIAHTFPTAAEDIRLTLGNNAAYDAAETYGGLVDEFRFWSKALTPEEVERNFWHTLSGQENGLAIYWQMDEGLENQIIAYDLSQTNSVANERHSEVRSARSSSIVPEESLLSISANTDADGNYVLRGVPFSGNGTNYVVTPVFGVHEFSPSSASRFVSTSSLVHSGVDFKDVSSFPVSGKVYYEGTTIPVEGAMVSIDGVTASREGKIISTDAEGSFVVDVPIGDHSISISLMGHTFADGGRFPADPDNVGTKYTFEKALSGLTFMDQTKVVVAGRVAGGLDEEEKPLCLGVGIANIGSAVIQLEVEGGNDRLLNAVRVENGLSYSYDMSSEQLNYEQGSPMVNSKAYVQAQANYITIQTDSATGEWAALLPPLNYRAKSISIPSQPSIDFSDKLFTLDASKAAVVKTDSLVDENGETSYFEYCASAIVTHRGTSCLEIAEHADGSFGEDSISAYDGLGERTYIQTKQLNAQGDWEYTFDYPVYSQFQLYTFDIRLFERYSNLDDPEQPVYNDVPLGGDTVWIDNAMSSEAFIEQSTGEFVEVNTRCIEMDSLGHARYVFRTGMPNLQESSHYTRGISIWSKNQEWRAGNPFRAIVLGLIPFGSDFVTVGPDKPMMILRDPPGSMSKTTYAEGTTATITTSYSHQLEVQSETEAEIKTGVKVETFVGLGAGIIEEMEEETVAAAGLSVSTVVNKEKGTTSTLTTTKEISTSDDPMFVGEQGDVFIGMATNVIIGQCNDLRIGWNPDERKYEPTVAQCFTSNEKFTTAFNYTTNHIENHLIPSLEERRNSQLIHVADEATLRSYQNHGTSAIYLTLLDEDDENYGSNNDDEVWGDKRVRFGGYSFMHCDRLIGPSYTIVMPEEYIIIQDSIRYLNSQIENWRDILAQNEAAKVEAINNRSKYLIENYSFDAGAIITNSVEAEVTNTNTLTIGADISVVVNTGFDFEIMGCGVDVSLTETVTTSVETSTTEEHTETTGYSYTLQEDGDDDYLSVDVLNAPDGFGPIFYTRAGATSAPYEDEVRTKYYEPGTVIQRKTKQIEKLSMEVIDPIVTGVPAGKDAVFRVDFFNDSETGEDNYYGIKVVNESNPNGAAVYVDGLNITDGAVILFPAGVVRKTLTLRQTNLDVLDYNIKLYYYSTSQPDDTGIFPGIYATGDVTVQFQPFCSDIELAVSESVVNTASIAPLTFQMSGYDYNQSSFEEIRLQYKGENDANYTTLQTFVKDPARVAADANLKLFTALKNGNKLTYAADLRNSQFSDQNYIFRALTVGYRNGNEITNSSEEIRVVRDMSRPQLLSAPTPSTGVLTASDNITIMFNEDIRHNSLSATNNFIVTGIMNESEVDHAVAMSLIGNATAKTESTINLSGRSFAVNMWLNYSHDGRILMHGTQGNCFTASIEEGKLVLAIEDTKVVSAETLPQNKWFFLALGYDMSGNEPTVNACYASADESKTLFFEHVIPEYNGNGALTLGGNDLVAKMHEVSLWDGTRTLADALSERNRTKDQFTTGLMGYWKMNEGHGKTAADCAHNRTMTLSAENAWWMEGSENYALKLDGKTTVSTILSTTATDDDSYMIELWFNASETKSAQSIINMSDLVQIDLNAKGQMEMTFGGNTITAYASNVADAQWHHLALNVLKGSNGSAILYVDGQARRQFTASSMPGLGMINHITLGAMTGAIDEVRVWNGRRTADAINYNMYKRVAADAVGLEAYYPMELRHLDSYNQIVSEVSAKDMTSDLELQAISEGAATEVTFGTEAPALASAPALENVQFDFVASERQITINLVEQPAKIENCNINLTVRNVQDANGNTAQPISWTIYVKQNQLSWSENEVEVRTTCGEAETFVVEIENSGANADSWILDGMPEWLTVSAESGTLAPLSSQKLRFTVDPSTAVGNYEATLFLTGTQNIAAPLNITLKVAGEMPDWNPVPDEEAMVIVAQLLMDGKVSSDPDDMIAAFRGQECVGVAKPVYSSRYDSYFISMTVYGNGSAEGAALTYKVYDASTGTVYPAVSATKQEVFTYRSSSWIGTFTNWVVFTPLNQIEQDLSLNRRGWKWFSMYVAPDDNTVGSIFADAADKISTIKSNSKSALCSDGMWLGQLKTLEVNTMYKLNANAAFEETTVGTPATAMEVEITLNSDGWNWIGYPVAATNSLAAAFAEADPQEGDVVMSQSFFAMYTEGEWMGSLSAMTPGQGYKYYSNAAGAKSFHYQTPVQSTRKATAKAAQKDVLWLTCEDNMALVANVQQNGQIVEDAVVYVYAGNELCGYSAASDAEGRHFVTIGGMSNARQLTFVVKIEDEQYIVSSDFDYQADAIVGSVSNPYLINLDNATPLAEAQFGKAISRIDIYDANGMLIQSVTAPSTMLKAEELEGTKAAIQRVIYEDGTVAVFKMMN